MTELDKIKTNYESGLLDSLKNQLENFICKHKIDILKFKEQEENHWHRSMDIGTAVKLFILNVRTIDMHAEMVDQIKALEEEVKRNQTHCDPNSLGVDWIRHHAPGWRGYRVLAIIYVFDQNKELLLKTFNT